MSLFRHMLLPVQSLIQSATRESRSSQDSGIHTYSRAVHLSASSILTSLARNLTISNIDLCYIKKGLVNFYTRLQEKHGKWQCKRGKGGATTSTKRYDSPYKTDRRFVQPAWAWIGQCFVLCLGCCKARFYSSTIHVLQLPPGKFLRQYMLILPLNQGESNSNFSCVLSNTMHACLSHVYHLTTWA